MGLALEQHLKPDGGGGLKPSLKVCINLAIDDGNRISSQTVLQSLAILTFGETPALFYVISPQETTRLEFNTAPPGLDKRSRRGRLGA